MSEVVRYLVQWKGFTVKHNSWKKEAVAEFERRLNAKVRWYKKINMVENRNFKREELLKKYMAKILYRWNNRRFKEKYLKELERN